MMQWNHQELKKLCEQLLACDDEDAAISMAEELRSALHEHIEELRRELRRLGNYAH